MTGSLYWYVARGSGMVAYLLITAAVCLGILLSRRWHARSIPRMVIDEAHRWSVITFYVFVLIHIVSIALDSYINFGLADLIVPFYSGYHRLWLSLGIIGFELSLAIGASVWVRRWIGYRAWHAMHLLTYPIFLMSLLHGIGIGSDTQTSWAFALYGGSLAAVLAAVCWRVEAIPAWRRPVVATAFAASLGVLAWAAAGPLALI